ncbi:hypothetical protein [Xenorhabdus ishibashii]|uniref:Prophage protein n=1 Tax=Xenorhabdus ishibashii TaxID=1034471 RepID=A0A2D0KBZ8_9GAMM|nr:hypothetical protein [Xenorhabdus ishibashii]PHM60951.1 prophage protein [Xenorhabdus ishibashii]
MITKNFRLNALANTYAASIYHDVTTRNGGDHFTMQVGKTEINVAIVDGVKGIRELVDTQSGRSEDNSEEKQKGQEIMINIDNAQNEIGLSGHIDDGREWADWLLKKANESKKAQVIPWVSVQDRMPVDDDKWVPLCLVYVSFGSISRAGYDYWNTDTQQWSEHENDEVTHWCYMDDVPAPVVEEKRA